MKKNRLVWPLPLFPLPLLFPVLLVVLLVIFHWVKLGNIEDISDSSNTRIFSSTGFRVEDGRYFLDNNEKGALVIKFVSTTHFREGYCYLNFYSNPAVENKISLSTNGDQWLVISKNLSYHDNKLSLTKYINGLDQFSLRFEVKNHSQEKLEMFSLNDLYLTSRSKPYQIRNYLYLSICIACLFYILRLKKISIRKSGLLTISFGLCLIGLVLKGPVSLDFSPDLLLLLFAIYLFLVSKGRPLSPPPAFYILILVSASVCFSTVETWFFQKGLVILTLFIVFLWIFLKYLGMKKWPQIILLFVIISGIFFRGVALWTVIKTGGEIGPDESGYDEFARVFQFTHFYQARFREPLFLAVVSIYFYILKGLGLFDLLEANNFLPIRSLTFLFSILLIVLTYKIARDLWDEKAGLIAAGLMAASSVLIMNAVRGTIMEFFSLLNLSLFYLLFIEKKMELTKKLLLLSIIGSALLLTRSSTPLISIFILVYAIITEKKYRNWKMIIPVLLAVLLASPFYINNKKKWGELNFIANYHATWWKNYEFADQVGHQRTETLQENAYSGERVTPYAYFFKFHSLSEVVKRVLLGYHMVFSKWIYKYETLVMPLMIVGLILIALSPYRAVAVMWAVMILPYTFIFSLKGGREAFVYESFPFLALSAAYVFNKFINNIWLKRPN